jgi:hypothetical protein
MTKANTEKNEAPTPNISAQLFLGCPISSKIRMSLNSSPAWQKVQTLPGENVEALKEVHHQDKDYIGTFLSISQPTLEDLQIAQVNVQKLLRSYCDDLTDQNVKLTIFPQIFLA